MGIWSWVSQVVSRVDFRNQLVCPGGQEHNVKWLTKGQTASGSLSVEEESVNFQHSFLPASDILDPKDAPRPITSEVVYVQGRAATGEFQAPESGVFFVTIDNSESWFTTITINLTIDA